MPENAPVFEPPAPPVNTYISRPVSITAAQWTGENTHDLWEWITAEFLYGPIPADPIIREHARPARLYVAANDAWLDLEVGEWIIKDALGFYPCKDSVFTAKYRPAPIEDQPADSSFRLYRHEYAENSFILSAFTGEILVSRQDLEEAYRQIDDFLYPNPGFAPRIAEAPRG